jgi:RNA polymerase sigma factor (sigma-70 family)
MPPEPRTAADLDDAAVVARCRAGDAEAWALLVARYQRLVYAIATRMGLDSHMAADVFQTVFARLVEHLPRIAEPERLQAWIVTTAKREGLLQRRRGQRTVSMTRDGDDDGGGDGAAPDWDLADEALLPEDQLGELQQVNRLRLALEQLDRRCRDLLRLLFVDAEAAPAYDEVARRMDMPVGSIGPTRARCLAKLRQLVA